MQQGSINSRGNNRRNLLLRAKSRGIELQKSIGAIRNRLLSDKAEIINKLIDEKKAYLDDEILKLHPAGYAICDYLAVILSENY